MLLRAKIGCEARIALMSLTSPLALKVNWISASPFSSPWRTASFGNAASPITLAKFEQTTAADTGAGGAAGAGAGGAIGVRLVTAGATGVVALIVGCAGGGIAICTSGGGM